MHGTSYISRTGYRGRLLVNGNQEGKQLKPLLQYPSSKAEIGAVQQCNIVSVSRGEVCYTCCSCQFGNTAE